MPDDIPAGKGPTVTTEQPAAENADDDTGFTEPPRLTRLGTLAELTLAGGLGSGDVLFGDGYDGGSGETSALL